MTQTTVGWHAPAIAEAVRTGAVTARRVAEDHLDAIEAREPDLRAFAHLDRPAALAAAAAVDADPGAAGPLAGVPIGVKDIIDVAGMPTTNGADIPVDGPAATDAAAVARLRAAGAVVVGKTVTTEFALFRPGPTTNPHDASRTPGGSSSGSAAVVGAGLLPLAVGTQTAGSIVRPASFCGVVGGKPTVGAVPRDGMTLCSPTLDTIGMIGSDVAGVALGLGVLADDPDAFRPLALAGPVGFVRTFEWDLIEPEVQSHLEAAVTRLRDAGVEVVEVSLPDALRGLVRAQQAIMGAETVTQLAEVQARHGELLSPALQDYLEDARAWRWAFEAALAHGTAAGGALRSIFDRTPVLLAPSVLGEAPDRASTGDPVLCRAWTLLGTPTVAVPGLHGPAGLPLGVQTIAAPGQDGRALGAAAHLADIWAAGH